MQWKMEKFSPERKVSELVQEILNKFAEEGLSVNEAKLILQRTIRCTLADVL